MSGPAAKPRVTVVRCKPCASRPVSHNTFYTLSRPNRPHTTSLPMTSSHPQYCSTSPNSLDTSVCAVEAAPLPFCMKLTGTDSSAPHGNVNLTSKLSDTASSHIGPLDQHSTSLTPVNINNCALTQPPERSPAHKGNTTSRTPGLLPTRLGRCLPFPLYVRPSTRCSLHLVPLL